jgi:superfamily I DNA/RNA helicase
MTLLRKDASSALGWLMKAGVAARLLGRSSGENGVRLSTIHSAKGLDAEAVYVLGVQNLDGLESEKARRLLYIAMTRARTTLCLSGTVNCRLLTALQGFRQMPGLERRAS